MNKNINEIKFENASGMNFTDYYNKYKSYYVYHLYNLNDGDLEKINDIIQDSFINVFRFIHTYDKSKSIFSTWVYKIVMNMSIEYNKKNKLKYTNMNYDELINLHVVDDDIVHHNENEIELVNYIINNKISAIYKDVLNLMYIEKYSLIEIANELNVSVQIVKNRLFKARKIVKKLYDESQKKK